MSVPRILAADISKRLTGIACGEVGSPPAFHSIRGDGMTDPEAAEQFFLWLQRRTKDEHFDAMFFEASISPAAFMGRYNPEKGRDEMSSNPATTVALAKMVGVFELVARLRSIPCEGVHVATARKHFLGSGRPDEPKKRVKACCEAIGWNPPNLDCADAGAIFYYGAIQTAPRLAQVITPLQQRAAATSVMGNTRADALDVPIGTPLRVDRNGQEHVDYRAARDLFKRRAGE
jgi:hypothetical protein